MTVEFSPADPSDCVKAFGWHRGFAAADNHLYPRDQAQFDALANDSQIIVAKRAGNYVGMCYYAFDDPEWEVGGLMVAAAERGSAIGSTLMRLALGHLLFDEDPISRSEAVVAHVHQANQAPRNVITRELGFQFRKSVSIPGALLPGLKTDANGMINGDEFELVTPATVVSLADWCSKWSGTTRTGEVSTIELSSGVALADWEQAFRQMALPGYHSP